MKHRVSAKPVLWLLLSSLLLGFLLPARMPVVQAQGTTPQTSGEFFAEGNKYYRVYDWDKAISNYNESIKMSADNATAYLMRGAAYQAQNELDKAIADYTKAIELDGWEYLAYFRRSKTYEIQGKKELAAADDREFRQRANNKAIPRTADEYYDRAVYFEDRGFFGDAINDYGAAIKLDPQLKKGFPFTSIYEKRADLYDLSGKSKEAREDYDRALTAQPKNIEVLMKRANFLYSVSLEEGDDKMADDAFKDFSAVIERAADLKWRPELLIRAYWIRAEIYKSKRELAKAIADYTEALKLDPKNADIFNSRGVAQADNGAHEKAIRDFDQALALDPKSASTYNLRGNSYRLLKELDRAIADYTKAIELAPEYFWPYFHRGIVHFDQSDWDKAEADYTRALTLIPKDVNTLNNRGIVYIKKKEWDKALADLAQAITLAPRDANAYNTRGVVYRNKEDWEKAIADYSQAITLNPKMGMYYRNRAFVYRKAGKTAEAESDEKKANELDPPAAAPATNPAPAINTADDDWWF